MSLFYFMLAYGLYGCFPATWQIWLTSHYLHLLYVQPSQGGSPLRAEHVFSVGLVSSPLIQWFVITALFYLFQALVLEVVYDFFIGVTRPFAMRFLGRFEWARRLSSKRLCEELAPYLQAGFTPAEVQLAVAASQKRYPALKFFQQWREEKAAHLANKAANSL